MIEITDPVVRPSVLDPLKVARWPVACALMQIRAVKRNWSPEAAQEAIRAAYRDDGNAFRADDPPFEEAEELLDRAVSNPGKFVLHGADGAIEPGLLGPDAKLLPTGSGMGGWTFGLWPNLPDDVADRTLNLWCLRQQVEAVWPLASAQVPATKPVGAVAKPEEKLRPAFKKIKAATEAEEKATGISLRELRPVERDKGLKDRMKAQGLTESELPKERTMREYFNQGPGKPAKSG